MPRVEAKHVLTLFSIRVEYCDSYGTHDFTVHARGVQYCLPFSIASVKSTQTERCDPVPNPNIIYMTN